MNMTLSKRGDYVMRSAISLARAFDKGSPRKIREVVADTDVPQTFASQILADLVRAGLATSKAGRDGGYLLSRPPEDVSVLEVIEAAEGPLRSERCALSDGPCRWDAVCPLHETWSEATIVLRDLLGRTSLAELAARDEAIEAGTYAVPANAHRSHPRAVTLADVVQVELPEVEVHRILGRPGHLLGSVARAAAADLGEAGGDGVSSRGRGSRRFPADASLAPVGSRNSKAEAARYLLVWRLAVRPDKRSRLEGEVTVGAVDPFRSELRVEGTWHLEGEWAGSAAELEQEARRGLRSLLRHLARGLESAT